MPSIDAPPDPNSPARDRILQTAHDLFYRDGIRATGIDKVIAESGVAKVTFYRHFPSKNALIAAFLDYRHQRWMTWFSAALIQHGALPGGGLAPLVPTLADWFEQPLFRGCAFINSVAELGGSSAMVTEIAQRHKQDMAAAIFSLLPISDNRSALANAVAIAVDGAIVKAQLDGNDAQASQALQGLQLLLDALSARGS